MAALYFLKTPCIIFLTGFLICSVGALVKIRHWPFGDELITFGSIILSIGIVTGIIKIIMLKKPQ